MIPNSGIQIVYYDGFGAGHNIITIIIQDLWTMLKVGGTILAVIWHGPQIAVNKWSEFRTKKICQSPILFQWQNHSSSSKFSHSTLKIFEMYL